MDNMKELNEVCETVSRAIASANEKIRGAGGKLSAGDAEYVDRLTHILKSTKAVMQMDEDMEDGYSERGYSRDGYSRDGYSRRYEGGSYAMGRGRYAKRDSMGRYSSNGGSYGYSGHGGMVEELRDLMQDAPDEQTRQDMQRLIQRLEQH